MFDRAPKKPNNPQRRLYADHCLDLIKALSVRSDYSWAIPIETSHNRLYPDVARKMPLQVNMPRAREGAGLPMKEWSTNGIVGVRAMLEDLVPEGRETGYCSHTLLLTLTLAINYMRDVDELWAG